MFFKNKKKFLSILLAIKSIFSFESLNLSQAQKTNRPKTQTAAKRKKVVKPAIDINFLKNHKNKIIGGTVFAALALKVFFSIFSSKQNQNKDAEAKEQIAQVPTINNSKTRKSPNFSVNKNDVKIQKTSTENGGLPNLGATCYMNSVLQMLFRVPGFRDRVINYNGADPVCCSLKEIFIKLYQNKRVERNDVLIFFKAANFPKKINESYDVNECLVSLKAKIEASIPEISSLFNMNFSNNVKFPKNPEIPNIESEPCEKCFPLTLEIPNTTKLSECIKQFFQQNEMEDWKLENGGTVYANFQNIISPPAEYIVLQMKRFTFDYSDKKMKKIDKQIQIDKKAIDFSDYIHGKSDGNNKYKIVGAINHVGSGIESGHYFYTHLIGDNEALLCDNLSVETIEIKKAWENIEKSYIILLKRI